MKTYWINLDERRDRAKVSKVRLKNAGIEATRISAVTRNQIGWLEETDDQHYFQGIVACRMSHIKVFKKFLATDEEYCLILEDDFLFKKQFSYDRLSDLRERMKLYDISLFQIGFLPFNGSREGICSNFFAIFLQKLFYLHELISRKIFPNRMHRGFLPGTHAYLVDRRIAKYLLTNCREKIKTPLDYWFNHVAKHQPGVHQKLLIARLGVSLIGQDEESRSDLQK